jgi:hypothetical protein
VGWDVMKSEKQRRERKGRGKGRSNEILFGRASFGFWTWALALHPHHTHTHTHTPTTQLHCPLRLLVSRFHPLLSLSLSFFHRRPSSFVYPRQHLNIYRQRKVERDVSEARDSPPPRIAASLFQLFLSFLSLSPSIRTRTPSCSPCAHSSARSRPSV